MVADTKRSLFSGYNICSKVQSGETQKITNVNTEDAYTIDIIAADEVHRSVEHRQLSVNLNDPWMFHLSELTHGRR